MTTVCFVRIRFCYAHFSRIICFQSSVCDWSVEPAAVHSNQRIYVHENEEAKRKKRRKKNSTTKQNNINFTTLKKIVKTLATNKNGKMEIVFRFAEAKDALNV